jgi:hypothetical protein
LVIGLVEVPHADLAEVTRVEFVEVRSVMMLATGHTATTGVFAVLANAAVTSRHMAAANIKGKIATSASTRKIERHSLDP